MNISGVTIDDEAALVSEAIMNEMARASRWCHVTACWDALLHVRRLSEQYRMGSADSGQRMEEVVAH